VTANTTVCFKTRLDKFWKSQDVKFDYKQNLTDCPIGRWLHNINALFQYIPGELY